MKTGVVIIGAGIAGLSAAYRLSQSGWQPIVLEASQRVGGRLETHTVDDVTFDLGGQVLYSSYQASLNLCRELGLQRRLTPLRGSARIVTDKGLSNWLQLFNSVTACASIAKLQLAMLLGAHRLPLRGRKFAPEYDAMDFETYVCANFGLELHDRLFQPFISALTHGETKYLSAACGLAYLRCGLGRSYVLRGGMTELTGALAAQIADIRLGENVAEVIIKNNSVTGVRIGAEPGRILECEQVVIATPSQNAFSLLGMLPLSTSQFLQSLRYGACIHVVLRLPKPAQSVYAILAPDSPGRIISCLLEDAHRTNKRGEQGVAHCFITGHMAKMLIDKSDQEIVAAVLADMQTTLPEPPASHDFAIVRRWPASVCFWGPGHARQAGLLLEEVGKIRGLHLAGDYTLIPSIEGSVCSGLDAADAIIATR